MNRNAYKNSSLILAHIHKIHTNPYKFIIDEPIGNRVFKTLLGNTTLIAQK